MGKLPKNKRPCSPKVGETLLYAIFMLLLIAFALNLFIYLDKRRVKEMHYHVNIKFIGGNNTKLVLNDEQYEQLKTILNQKDGFFEIGDDLDNVKIYREHVCAVEVKKK